MTEPYRLRVTASAGRAIQDKLPEPVAAAVIEFITATLLENPHRVGKALHIAGGQPDCLLMRSSRVGVHDVPGQHPRLARQSALNRRGCVNKEENPPRNGAHVGLNALQQPERRVLKHLVKQGGWVDAVPMVLGLMTAIMSA